MSCLYVVEQGSKIKHIEGQFVLEVKVGEDRIIPDETLESISIFGNSVLTTQAIKACLEKDINVSFLSTKGKYFGRLLSNTSTNPDRLKAQVYLSDNAEECLKIDKYFKDGDNIRIYRLQEYEEVKVYGTRNYADEEIIVI